MLYWFTGMTEQEVYDLALASHKYYTTVETSKETWTTPEDIESVQALGGEGAVFLVKIGVGGGDVGDPVVVGALAVAQVGEVLIHAALLLADSQ